MQQRLVRCRAESCHRSALCRYCSSLTSWRKLTKCGWDAAAARATVARFKRAAKIRAIKEHGYPDADADDGAALRPHFALQTFWDGRRKRAVYQCTVALPRFCTLGRITGKAARSRRAARERAALAAVKALHENGDIDDHLVPRADNTIAEFVGASSREDWLTTRVAGDRILESNWKTLQTWRKPPVMRAARNVPLALDVCAAAALREQGADY